MEKLFRLTIFFSYLLVASCRQPAPEESDEGETETHTPVTITQAEFGPVKETIELNATSAYRQQSFVKANLNGYVKKAFAKKGNQVSAGQTLFVLKTKEAEAIGNAVNKLNPSFNFSGTNYIRSHHPGFVLDVNHQEGDYVQDGEQLAVISDANSFYFIMNVPYEDRPYVSIGKDVIITLPDESRLAGYIQSVLPSVDSSSQTQAVAVKLRKAVQLPENLVARVSIVKVAKAASITLAKQAVLSDESLSEHWIMKLINDTTAIKVPVKTGLETGEHIEILSPELQPKDNILLSGNYGLSDTAFVIVTNRPGSDSTKSTDD